MGDNVSVCTAIVDGGEMETERDAPGIGVGVRVGDIRDSGAAGEADCEGGGWG